ncbi:MAG: MBL fold metallo-hydrolase [Eubacterium sp.]
MDTLSIKVLASGSNGNCYHVDDGHTGLLIEAGIPRNEIVKKLGFSVYTTAGALISHEHQDHSKAVLMLMKYGLDVYMSGGTAAALGVSGHRVHEIKAHQTFTVGTYQIIPFPTKHDAREPMGYFIRSDVVHESLLSFTDTYYLEYIFEDVNYIIGECNYSKAILRANLENGSLSNVLYERIYRSHMSIETLKDFLLTIDRKELKQIYLAHLSDTNSNAALFKREIQRLTGAEVIVT